MYSTYNSVGGVPKPLGVEVGLVHGSENVEGVTSGISCSHVIDKYAQLCHVVTCIIDPHLGVILVKVGRVIECHGLADSSYSCGTEPRKMIQ